MRPSVQGGHWPVVHRSSGQRRFYAFVKQQQIYSGVFSEGLGNDEWFESFSRGNSSLRGKI